MRWNVMFSYTVFPSSRWNDNQDHFKAKDTEDLLHQVEDFAKTKKNKPKIPLPLDFEVMTDQVDVYFQYRGRRRRFMTLMAGE